MDLDVVDIHWNSVSGRVYSVEWTDDLIQGFTNTADSLFYPQSSYTEAAQRTERKYFYRVNVRK